MSARTGALRVPPRLPLVPGLAAGLAVASFVALLIGPCGLSPGEPLAALLGRGDAQAQIVV